MAVEQTSRTQLACKVVDLRRIGPKKEQSTSQLQPNPPSNCRAKSELRTVRIWADKQKRLVPLERKFNAYMREFEILSSISHANIIALDKVFITDNNIYIFQDLVTAGDLFSYIKSKNHKLLEVEAAVIIRQVLIAVQHLHEQNIAHRDIKPENVMLKSLVTGARVVLTDFGSARLILPMQRAKTFAGTEEYGAPEMMNQRSNFFSERKKLTGYSLAVDMWSIGTISTLLLVGFRAFDSHDGKHDSSLALKAELGSLEDDSGWRSLGERPKNFVRRLLVLEENERLTAKQALQHPWFSNKLHKINFEELYKRTVKNWRPRIPNLPLIEFVQGRCYEVKYFESSQKILDEQTPSKGRSRTPVEPPYRPFYRKVYDQAGLWPPKRKRGYRMSKEQEKAIEKWDTIMSEPSSPSCDVQQSTRNLVKKPTTPSYAPTSPSSKSPATATKRLQLLTSEQIPIQGPNRFSHGYSTPIIKEPAERSIVPKTATRLSSSRLPSRPSLARSISFHDVIPRSLALPGIITSRSGTGNAPMRDLRIKPSDPRKTETPRQSQTWSLNVRSRSRLRSRAKLANIAMASKLSKRHGGSVFDIVVEAETSRKTRLETQREARDSIQLAELRETIVEPHGAHLRLNDD